uniref:NET domain-containing protein n=1 Tax=viral metagenome TaxID=1070528 RepID=A0A6C0EJ65_9ZZZZ
METLLEVTDVDNTTTTITNNEMINVNELIYIRDKIENMSKYNQINILGILKNYPEITLNENSYGIHINLSDVKRNVINALLDYIKYVYEQENELLSIEQQKEDYKNVYFVKDNKDNSKVVV